MINKKLSHLNIFLFYFLSFTWGLPMTLVGMLVALVLLLTGHKPKTWNYCLYFNVGENWGGCSIGPVFLTGKKEYESVNNHEHGHAIQNCFLGVFMPFVVALPSAIRYQYLTHKYFNKGKEPPKPYDSIWFEHSATVLGTELNDWLNGEKL